MEETATIAETRRISTRVNSDIHIDLIGELKRRGLRYQDWLMKEERRALEVLRNHDETRKVIMRTRREMTK